jgi:hypothetical protein
VEGKTIGPRSKRAKVHEGGIERETNLRVYVGLRELVGLLFVDVGLVKAQERRRRCGGSVARAPD